MGRRFRTRAAVGCWTAEGGCPHMSCGAATEQQVPQRPYARFGKTFLLVIPGSLRGD
jgi:hypothetical protein